MHRSSMVLRKARAKKYGGLAEFVGSCRSFRMNTMKACAVLLPGHESAPGILRGLAEKKATAGAAILLLRGR